MKIILIVLISLFMAISGRAQIDVSLNYADFTSYLKERTDSIELYLYKLAVKGKIRAYKNDSLTSFYNIEELSNLGTQEEVVAIATDFEGEYRDSIIPMQFDQNKDLLELKFSSKQINTSPGSHTETLYALSIYYATVFSYHQHESWMVICSFDWATVQKELNDNDRAFLEYLYFLKSLEPLPCDVKGQIVTEYMWQTIATTGHTQYNMTGKEYKTISSMIYYSFPGSFLNGLPEEEKIFINLQDQRHESKADLKCRYFYNDIIPLPTENPGEFKDSIITTCFSIYMASTKFRADKTLTGLVFEFAAEKKNKDNRFKFTHDLYLAPWSEIRKYHPNPWMVWFLEDYYRYLSAR